LAHGGEAVEQGNKTYQAHQPPRQEAGELQPTKVGHWRRFPTARTQYPNQPGDRTTSS